MLNNNEWQSFGDLFEDYISDNNTGVCIKTGINRVDDMRNETEMLLQVWADVLRDVQNDKEFVQQVERAAQDAAFRTRSGAVWAEVMRRLQKAGALPGEG